MRIKMGMILWNLGGCEKSGVCHVWFGLEYIVPVYLPTGSDVVHAVSEMVYWLTHEILISSSSVRSFDHCALISLFLVHNSTIKRESKVQSSHSICPCHDHELTPSTAYTKYRVNSRLIVSYSQLASHFSFLCALYCSLLSTFPQ